MGFPHRRSKFLRYLVAALLLILTHDLLIEPHTLTSQLLTASWGRQQGSNHPIDALVSAGEAEFAAKLSKSTQTLSAAAAAYRKRRGRHPPPGFDKWFEFATKNDALIVEDYWDQIYHDLEPFWGVRPARIRKDAREFEMRITVRDGVASTTSDWFWTKIWLDMIQTIEHLLPDMDLALNPMDEPRVVVQWEEMDEYMKKAAKTRKMADASAVVSEFGKLPPPDGEETGGPPVHWETDKHYWPITRRGCAPDSPAREAKTITEFDKPPFIASSFNPSLAHMKDGYVANYTLSTDFCQQPDLQALQGVFVEPISVSTTHTLIPIFGGSKLSSNNDILLPAAIYWSEEERFTGVEGASIAWSAKHDSAVWRGVATGGRNRETNWRSFQRHRFVAMNNSTLLSLAASDPITHTPPNFALPSQQYTLPPIISEDNTEEEDLPTWLDQVTDISFTDLMCSHEGFGNACDYTGDYFAPTPQVPMAKQFKYKYLPDIDGNSFSGRYLGFLRSTSLPVKATLWREWHDSRLVAWKHFVPMDARFGDWWGILKYFLKSAKRDRVAEGIALGGREWAGRVLRREDMSIYVLRVLLEYARLGDERREQMGWVGDLK